MVDRRDSEPVAQSEIDDALRARTTVAVGTDRRLRWLRAAVERALFAIRALPRADCIEIGAL